jgi:hypothetical protein
MTILVIGDSFSFGSELSDLYTTHVGWQGNKYSDPATGDLITIEPSQLAWPALLGKKLNQSVENISIPGSSNDRIFRKATTYSMSKPYDLIICAWTTVDRYDFTWNEQELQLSINHGMPQLTWFKEFVTNHHSSKQAYQKWIGYVVCLQAFFELRKQPYVFLNAMQPSFCIDPVLLDNQPVDISTQINHNRYIEWGQNFCNWCRHTPHGVYGHFLEEGHQLVADKVYTFIKDKSLIRHDA